MKIVFLLRYTLCVGITFSLFPLQVIFFSLSVWTDVTSRDNYFLQIQELNFNPVVVALLSIRRQLCYHSLSLVLFSPLNLSLQWFSKWIARCTLFSKIQPEIQCCCSILFNDKRDAWSCTCCVMYDVGWKKRRRGSDWIWLSKINITQSFVMLLWL